MKQPGEWCQINLIKDSLGRIRRSGAVGRARIPVRNRVKAMQMVRDCGGQRQDFDIRCERFGLAGAMEPSVRISRSLGKAAAEFAMS